MAGQVTNNIEYLMRERIEPNIAKTYNVEDSLGSKIGTGTTYPVSTRATRIVLEVTPGGTTAGTDFDGGTNPTGSGQQNALATLSTVGVIHARQITSLANWGTDSNEKAIEEDLARSVAIGISELKYQEDCFLQIGTSGVLATISDTGSAPTYSVAETDGTNPFGASLLREGNSYDIYDTTQVTKRANGPYTIAANGGIDLFGQKVTFTASITGGTDGDVIVIQNMNNAAFQGLPYHVSDSQSGSWQGIARTFPYTRSTAVDAGKATLQLPMLLLLKGLIRQRKGANKVNMLTPYFGPAQEQAYQQLAQPTIEIFKKSDGNESFDLLFGEGTMFNRTPMVDSHADPNKIYFLEFGAFIRAEVRPIGFKTDSKGNRMFPVYGTSTGVPNNADWFAVVHQWQLGCTDPTNMGLIENLQTPAGWVGYISS